MTDIKPNIEPTEPEVPVKKGRATWAPAKLMEVVDKDPSFVYRWLLNTPANLQKKRLEGWEVLSGVTKDQAKHIHPRLTDDGKPLTSVKEYRELVLGRLPKEQAEARREYFADLTRRQTIGVVDKLKRDVTLAAGGGPAAPVHGEIIRK